MQAAILDLDGWGAVLIYKDIEKEISGSSHKTTNNIMEMTAVIESLKILKEKCNLTIYSDSVYVVNAFEEKWIDRWIKNNWRNANNKKVKNKELWQEMLELLNNHKYKFIKVEGHSDNKYNNRCDYLATHAIRN